MKVLVTGGCGFIGSSFIKFLNNKGITNIDICEPENNYQNKWKNLIDLRYNRILDPETVLENVAYYSYDAVVHLGANSDTSQLPNKENWDNNINFSRQLIYQSQNALRKPIIVFASSAAVYGKETVDFSERLNVKPTNFYGFTKLDTEKRIQSLSINKNIYSLRFFNVYGGREMYKRNMSSPIFKWLNQEEKEIILFLSSNDNFKTSDMRRDFIYVYDVCEVIFHCLTSEVIGGTYNVGSGVATAWDIVAKEVFKAKNIDDGTICYALMPEKYIDHYQYYTCADLFRLRNELGYQKSFTSIKDGVRLTLEEMINLY